MTNHSLIARCTALLVVLATTVAASGAAEFNDDAPGWLIGAGYVLAPNPFIGGKDVSQPLPLIGYVGERLTWVGPSLKYRLLGEAQRQFSVKGEMRFEGLKSSPADSRLLRLRERKPAFELGATARFGYLYIDVNADASNRHRGMALGASLRDEWPLADRWLLEGSVNASWRDARLADYYYGVSAAEAAPGLAPYAPGAALNWGASAELSFRARPRLMFFAGLGYERLSGGLAASPLINRHDQREAHVGVLYALGGRR